MKGKILLEIFCLLFVMLFVYTGLSKLLTFSFYLADLQQSPILGRHSMLIAYSIPILEIIIAIGLLVPRTRTVSLYAFLGMMVMFTGYIAYMLTFSDDRPCTCGGVIREMSWPQHLVFNGIFIVMAFFAIKWQKAKFPNDINQDIVFA